MKDEAGAVSTIMPPSASRPMGSWWPNGAVFPPLLAPVKWGYPSPKCAPVPSSGVAPCAWSGITPGRLLPFHKPWHGLCSANFRAVLFVKPYSYNTVVLAGCGKTRNAHVSVEERPFLKGPRKAHRINAGFGPCGRLWRANGFFRSLLKLFRNFQAYLRIRT